VRVPERVRRRQPELVGELGGQPEVPALRRARLGAEAGEIEVHAGHPLGGERLRGAEAQARLADLPGRQHEAELTAPQRVGQLAVGGALHVERALAHRPAHLEAPPRHVPMVAAGAWLRQARAPSAPGSNASLSAAAAPDASAILAERRNLNLGQVVARVLGAEGGR
jgi:hypothetical protein